MGVIDSEWEMPFILSLDIQKQGGITSSFIILRDVSEKGC